MNSYPHRTLLQGGRGRRCTLAKKVLPKMVSGTGGLRSTSTGACMTRTPAHHQPLQTLDLEAVAHMLRCSVRHLRDLRQDDPTFPAPRMLGTSPRWTYETIHAWVESPSRVAADVDAVCTPAAAAGAAPAAVAAPTADTPRRAAAKKGAARVH